MTETKTDLNRHVLVGVGASAGGLEALNRFFSSVSPVDAQTSVNHLSFVVLQHLSPTHKSMMADILARDTSLTVQELTDREALLPGHVYVVPANYNASLDENGVRLKVADPDIAPKPSVNEFFISLAAEYGDAAVGIVLSGTGSDGTAGLRAIQAAGGITIAQNPDSAKYPGMPQSAIEAGVADFVLEPAAIAKRLLQLVPSVPLDEESFDESALTELLELLKTHRNVNFSGYKLGTLLRRIRRRILATGHQDLNSYLTWVHLNLPELDVLTRDLLISVTAFFRDKEAFDALSKIAVTICEDKKANEEIRIWVAGCATGEEAYSLAIIFNEALKEKAHIQPIQIFATDIDEDALNVARRGLYPKAALSGLPEAWRERYFHNQQQYLEVNKRLRDMIVFARHNLVDDPPFLRLDLVACRNVLIYFDTALQSRVLQRFHFSLNNDAYLFLGRSESISQAEGLFDPLNRKERLFRKNHTRTRISSLPSNSPVRLPRKTQKENPYIHLIEATAKHLNATLALCDDQGVVQHTVGDVGRFFRFPAGRTRLQINEIITPEFQADVMAMMYRFNKHQETVSNHPKKFQDTQWQLSMFPVAGEVENLRVLLICPAASSLPRESAGNTETAQTSASAQELEYELNATREHLQSLIEELATANEEMQSLNEEAQASNEELQASNEEMEAANEELQATNEELISLNGELNQKTAELSQLNSEYRHLYDAMDFPILVFNHQARLKRFNAPASRRFNLRETSLRQPCRELKLQNYLSELPDLLEEVLSSEKPTEQLLRGDDRSLQLNITPGLDHKGYVESLVVTMIDITDILQVQTELKASQNRLNTLMENSTILMSMKDLSGRYIYANQRFLSAFNLPEDAYQGKSDFDLFPPETAGSFWSKDLESMRTTGLIIAEHSLDDEGNRRHLRSVHQLLRDDQDHPSVIINETEDITHRKHAENQLRIAARVFEHSGEAIVVTDASAKILTINEAFTQITGFSQSEASGERVGSLLSSGRHSHEFYKQMWEKLSHKGHWQGEIWNKRKNGEIYPEWLTINKVAGDQSDDDVFVAVFADISDLKDSQRQVEFLATHDTLTHLPNRTLFQDRLNYAIAQSYRTGHQVALLFIDLDNFKVINDTLGHDAGDQLLIEASERLRGIVRDIDTVARLGGDEFTVILPDSTVSDAEKTAYRILSEMSLHFDIYDRKAFVSASVGAAFYPSDADDAAGLLKAADTAMYKAKDSGRNRLQLFRAEHRVHLLKEAAIESALREALHNQELTLVFQPQFDAADTRRIRGAEALIRWQDKTLGPVSPGEFIPIAEKTGLIADVSQFVEDSVIRYILDWRKQDIDIPTISINISAHSFRESGYIRQLQQKLMDHNLPLDAIQIEITEGTLMSTSGSDTDTIEQMRSVGLDFSIDDFGTGYSSLSYLKTLPVTELKVDKSFVDGLGTDSSDEEIARAILSLSKALNLRTVAEGVETDAQLQWLQREGCDVIQGYLLARPLQPDALLSLFTHQTDQ